MMRQAKNSDLLTLFAVVFFSYAGFSLPFPILTPMFMEAGSGFLEPALARSHGAVLLGVAFFLYSFGQFLGSTFLGSLSDAKGRKKTLLLALGGSLSTYLLSTWAVVMGSLPLFFLGRLLTGFFEGSAGIAQAYVADLTQAEERVSSFSRVNVAASLGWLVGPLLGSLLAGHPIPGLSAHASVFLWSALISAGLLVAACLFLKEFRSDARRSNLLESYRHLQTNISFSTLRPLLLLNLLTVMAFACFQQFFPSYLFSHFGYGEREVSYAYTYLSIVWIVAQQFWVTPMSKHWSPGKGFSVYTSILAVAMAGMISWEQQWVVLALIPLVAVGASGALTHAVGILSLAVPDENQGAALGINRAVHALGRGAPSIFAGYLGSVHCNLPLLAGALLCILAFWVGRWTEQATRRTGHLASQAS